VILITRKVGRLANRLLLFAQFIGAAVEHGFAVANPAFARCGAYFPSTAGDLLCRFPPDSRLTPFPGSRELLYALTRVAGGALCRLEWSGRRVGTFRLDPGEKLDLGSDRFLDAARRHSVLVVQDWWFRSPQYCAKHRDVIRAFLTPWERHLEAARRALAPAREPGRFVIGVHVRRRDYSVFKDGRFLFSHDQYRRIMESAAALLPDREVSFVVCSDEDVPTGAFAGLDVIHGTGHPVEDLYALASCDRLIGPPSTYTAWASYYGAVPLYRIEDPAAAPQADSFETLLGLSSGWSGGGLR
jgi:hypothetical protein